VAACLRVFDLFVRVFNIEIVVLFFFAFNCGESNRAFIRPNSFSVKNFFRTSEKSWPNEKVDEQNNPSRCLATKTIRRIIKKAVLARSL
jgi:hypothetical protein